MDALNTLPLASDREQRIADLVEESGPKWADAYRPGSIGCHELLDRVSLLMDMADRFVVDHPACLARREWYSLADQAAEALRELYQRVGAAHLGADEVGG